MLTPARSDNARGKVFSFFLVVGMFKLKGVQKRVKRRFVFIFGESAFNVLYKEGWNSMNYAFSTVSATYSETFRMMKYELHTLQHNFKICWTMNVQGYRYTMLVSLQK